MDLIWIVGTLIYSIIMGFVTKIIINNKGYDDNWFWWGFFFGILAIIVACAKPQNIRYTSSGSSSFYNHGVGGNTTESERIRNQNTLNAGGWQCHCGRLNAAYVSSCTCGRSKSDVRNANDEEQKREVAKKQAEIVDESAKVSALKGYKELLDSGVITQEEFDAKKKQLLG